MIASTIRHDTTGRAIVAYLSAVDAVRQTARIVDYMALMHFVERGTTEAALKYLIQADAIERVAYGRYRRRSDKQP